MEKKGSGRSRAPGGADATPSPSQTPSPGPSGSALPDPQVSVTPTVQPSPDLQGTQDCYKAEPFICEVERAIARQTNELRGTRTELRFSKKLGFAARLWSESQGRRGGIGHAGFPRARMADLATEFGSTSGISMSAENVAMTGASATDAEAVARAFTRMWWSSPGHHRNMVGRHQAIGVGVYVRGNGTYYATQIFGAGD